MSKIEITSKVSLTLPSRINLGMRGTIALSSRLKTKPTSSPTSSKTLTPGQNEPIAPTGTTNNHPTHPPPKTKPATNSNHRPCPKRNPPAGQTPEGEARIRPAPNPGHSPQAIPSTHSPENYLTASSQPQKLSHSFLFPKYVSPSRMHDHAKPTIRELALKLKDI